MNTYTSHYEESALINASASDIFSFIDDQKQFSSHMSKPTWQMGGGSMEVVTDEGKGRVVGSHMTLKGSAFGITVSLDEVITVHDPPRKKEWETVGEPHLIVVGFYKMDVVLKIIDAKRTEVTVSIDYNMPKKLPILGNLFGGLYAKWCVRQMLSGTKAHFTN